MKIPSSLWQRTANNQTTLEPRLWQETLPFFVLATLAVIGRYFARRFRNAALGADDYMCLVAWIFTAATFAVAIIDYYLGVGTHTDKASKETIVKTFKTSYGAAVIYAFNITTIKLSILLFYQRVFSIRNFIVATHIVGAICVAWGIAVLLVSIFSCTPIHGYWNIAVKSTCIKPSQFYIAAAVPNIATDVIILCMPLRMVWNLQTKGAQKIQLTVMFLTGAFAIVASSIRIVFLLRINRTDPLYTTAEIAIWTSIEPSVGVICACLPTLRPLLKEMWFKSAGVGTYLRTMTSTTGRNKRYQLEAEQEESRRTGGQTKWTDSLDAKINGTKSRTPAVETSVKGPATEMDDFHAAEIDDFRAMGINVQHDLHVESAPIQSPLSR